MRDLVEKDDVKQKIQLTKLLKSISLLGRNVNLDDNNGLNEIFNLPEDFNPLFFTQIFAKQSFEEGN